MNDFCAEQWQDLCRRIQDTAELRAEVDVENKNAITAECEKFCSLDQPSSYAELLERTSQARDLAVAWVELASKSV